ncbi:DUF6417 family protein [Streptomyces sp. NPDC001858]
MRAEKILDALEAVLACEEKLEHGWVLDTVAEPLLPSVRGLAERGLVERADRETRAELSAWEGGAVGWAVRLSAAGHDLLAYARNRPDPAASRLEPGQRLVELLPSQMAVLQVFVGTAGQLRTPPAPGLAQQVWAAVRDGGRWRLYLTREQMESAAYGFWLHRLSGSASEANRFSREYAVTHRPSALPLTSAHTPKDHYR